MLPIELGLDTFGDATVDADGQPRSQAQAIRDVVTQGELADQVGLAFIGVGEHHRPDFSVSAPEVVLAAIAARTTRIHLGSAVTVLSTDDPVRVFERFSTLNAISNGRAEIIVGRGSFTESYPLFGYDLANYEELFEEHLAFEPCEVHAQAKVLCDAERKMRIRGAANVEGVGRVDVELSDESVGGQGQEGGHPR